MTKRRIDEDRAFAGFIWGLLLGGVYAVFNGPRIRLQELLGAESDKSQQDQQTRPDSLRSSIDEGKKAARERKLRQGR